MIDNNRRAYYDAIYFDIFEVKHVPKEIEKLIGNKNLITNNYRMQAYDLIMCEYFCIEFIDFMLEVKSLLDFLLMIMRRMTK